ncbi:PREDICTED: uncharacterized protein LOC109169113 [Ipomoea nil]|uniref:uncharacterized protein LOC109169113 n=1 Tax=Ipomoea nil TaxID=35883 RepID=UPI000900C055|nr:PREDICTED: uncharacterized protein LOC109169113 [Ipomoea nil]
MNVEVPASPLANKGFKLTKQSLWKSTLRWNAIPANRNPGERFHSNHQGLGIQLAQLGRDASAAVAQVTKEVAWTVLDMHPTLFSLARAYSLLDGDVRAHEELLKKQSNNLISATVSKNIFQLIWGS